MGGPYCETCGYGYFPTASIHGECTDNTKTIDVGGLSSSCPDITRRSECSNHTGLTVQAALNADAPADPYSGELGRINLRLLARKMLWVLRYLKRQGVYHPAMDDLIEDGTMHGLGLEGPIPDPDLSVHATPSDREKRLEEALRWYADEQNYMRDYARYTGTERRSWVDIDEGDKARAALADATTNGG